MWFLALSILLLIFVHRSLIALVTLAWRDERYTHLLVIPFMSIGLLWPMRRILSIERRRCLTLGIPLLFIAVGLFSVMSAVAFFSGTIAAIILIWIAVFILCYGVRPLEQAPFPFLFLLLMVPLPESLLNHAVAALQRASAEVAHGLFKLAGVPFLRNGFQFSLPGVDIEVAQECSGIRSSLSLFIASILAGHLFFTSGWRTLVLALFAIPVVIFKNGLRIAAISYLGVYVDHDFLYGNLHRYGGLPFSALALAILALLLLILRRSERGCRQKEPGSVQGCYSFRRG